MRIDGVLYIEDGKYLWVTPDNIRRMCRSRKHSSRYFSIRGGPNAVRGWQNFEDSFKVDDMESARYLSWYHGLLQQLYVLGVTLDQVQEILNSNPTLYLPRDFYEATGQPKNPALVLISPGAKSIIGAHAKITEEHIFWRLESRYATLFAQLAALAIACIGLYDFKDPPFLVGWVWKDRKISSWKDWNKLFSPSRAWFARRYSTGSKTITSCYFDTKMLKGADDLSIHEIYDTDIYVPSRNRQVKCNRLALEAWRPQKKRIVLNPVKRVKERRTRTKKATWFS